MQVFIQLLIHYVSMQQSYCVGLWLNIHYIISKVNTHTEQVFPLLLFFLLLLVLINIQFKYTNKIVKTVNFSMTQYINIFPKIEILLRFQDLHTWATKTREGQRKVW